MNRNAVLVFVFLLVAVCQGFEFTLTPRTSPLGGSVTASQSCGVLECKENLGYTQPSSSRKVAGLTIYTRVSGDGEESNQWTKLATVTLHSPLENRVSNARHISGLLTTTEALLHVEMLKADECQTSQFSCLAVLVDSANQTTLLQSIIGGNLESTYSPEYEELVENISQLSLLRKKTAGKDTGAQLMVSLMDQLKCIKERLEDAGRRGDRFEDAVESLKTIVADKIYNLGNTLRDQSDLSQNRVQDRLDRLENRLEDKLSSLTVEQSQDDRDSFVQIRSQLAQLMLAVQSTERNSTYLNEQFNKLETHTASATAALDSRLAGLASEVSKLMPRVNGFTQTCADGAASAAPEPFDVLGTGRKEWTLAFRGTAYNNVEILPAFVHGTGIPAEVEAGCRQFNYTMPCINHYRNLEAMENWDNVDEILLGVFKKGQLVKKIVFNGHGSTPTTWFEANRVILSSWTDMKTQSHNFFSMEGELRPQYRRGFFINHDYTTCETFRGWFFIGESTGNGCSMEKSLAVPIFQYAKVDTMAVWASDNVERADAIGIFLKYE